MSWVEIALFIVSVSFIGIVLVTGKSYSFLLTLISLTGLGLLLGHVLFDVPNWQLYPLYFFLAMASAVGLVALALKKQGRTPRDNRKKLLLVGVVTTVISGLLMGIFPVGTIPEPKGDYKVGTFTFELTDPDRIEQYGAADGLRRIRVQAWYPADSVEEATQTLWFPDGVALPRSLAREMHLPFFALDHTADILSNAFLEVPMSTRESAYPVIILSHGWKGFRNLHTDFAELLASNGYVVFGIDHTYGAQMTVFEDGFEAEVDHRALPDRDETTEFIQYANKLVLTYAGDIKLVLDTLDVLNEGDITEIVRGRLDLTKIGLLGHSTGGGAGVAAALSDDRVKAVFGLDAWVEPIGKDALDHGLDVPAFFLRSEQWEGGINDSFLVPMVEKTDDAEIVQIEGSTHIDFTMSAMFSSLTGVIGFTGEMDRETTAGIQHGYVLEFFHAHLQSRE